MVEATDRKHAVIIVLFISTALASTNFMPGCASTPDSWTTKAPMLQPTSINSIGIATLNGKIYAAAPAGTAAAYIEVYDPSVDTWTQKSTIPSDFHLHAFKSTMAACQGKLYIIDGSRGLTVSYDPATDSWENRTSMPIELDSTMSGMQANVVGGKIYVIGGKFAYSWTTFDKILQTNEVYDPMADEWSELAPIPIGVTDYASTVMDDKIYIIGGVKTTETTALYNLTKRSTYTNLVQVYDTKTDQWTNETPLPTKMSAMAASATTGAQAPKRIYVVGGIPANEAGDPLYGEHELYLLVNWMQSYNPETQNWSNVTSMPTARRELCLLNLNDKLYALGGAYANGMYTTANEVYTPADYGTAVPEPSPTIHESPSSTNSPSPSATASEFPVDASWIVAAAIIIAAVAIGALIYFKRRKG